MSSEKFMFRARGDRAATYRQAIEAAIKREPSLNASDWLRRACDAQASRDLDPINGRSKNRLVPKL